MMKLKGRSLIRGENGYAVLIPEDGVLKHLDFAASVIFVGEDLWHVYSLIREGDEVSSMTHRKVTRTGSKSGDSETIHLRLRIKVEGVDFDADGEEMRLKGRNQTESEYVRLGAYHTLVITPNKFVQQLVSLIGNKMILESLV